MLCMHCVHTLNKLETPTHTQLGLLPETEAVYCRLSVLFPCRANKDLLPSNSVSFFL